MKHVSLTSTLARASKAVLAVVFVFALAPAAFAADEAAPNKGSIAVVDLQFLVSTSKAGTSIRTQLENQRNAYRGQIEKQEADLRKAEKDLVAQQDQLPKEDFLKKRKEFQDKVIAAQKSVQQRRVAFDKAYTGALEKLREQIVKIVADIAGKNDVALVLNRQEVVLVDAKMDITKQVLDKLDDKVSTIPVSIK